MEMEKNDPQAGPWNPEPLEGIVLGPEAAERATARAPGPRISWLTGSLLTVLIPLALMMGFVVLAGLLLLFMLFWVFRPVLQLFAPKAPSRTLRARSSRG
jgi:hypothetical protein